MDKKDLRNLTYQEMESEFKAMGLPSFRAKQVFSWIHEKQATSFQEMTNLSKDLRKKLEETYEFHNCKMVRRLESKIDGTIKYLYELYDGEIIESVLMKYRYGYSVCVSTQVGCNMKCSFCASTIDGCVRSLSAGEILDQVYAAIRDTGERISNVVLMGMGEPFMNYDNVIRFLTLITDERGVGLGARHITISTCGIVPKIYELMKRNPQYTLSISLHAPNNNIRTKIMPVNRKWDIDELLKACREYTEKTSRRISFEYAMIHGVNDTDDCAYELADRLSGMLCHVNLIPANEVRENDYERSSQERLRAFAACLESRGIATTIRRTLGPDIDASCGQLRRKHKKEEV